MNKIPTPKPVGYVCGDTTRADMDASMPPGTTLVSTVQMEAYRDDCVREALQSPEIQALKKNAARYRWLRSYGIPGLPDAQSVLQCQMVDGGLDVGRVMDEAIDAVMKKRKPE